MKDKAYDKSATPHRGSQYSDLECSTIAPYGTPWGQADVLSQRFKVLDCDAIG